MRKIIITLTIFALILSIVGTGVIVYIGSSGSNDSTQASPLGN